MSALRAVFIAGSKHINIFRRHLCQDMAQVDVTIMIKIKNMKGPKERYLLGQTTTCEFSG